jgi:putative phage-type endonuclease
MQLFDKLSKTEDDDYFTMIYDAIIDELNEDPMLYINPDFMERITQILFENYFEDWLEMDLCEEEDDEDIFNYLFTFVLLFFENQNTHPYRSQSMTEEIEDLEYIQSQIDYLRNLPQPTQRTDEWYKFRHNLLTASNIWKAFGSESVQNSLIYEKCKSFSDKSSNIYSASMQWGNIFEPLSIEIYEKIYNTKIEDFGCIQHDEYKFIGASPDGINVDPSSKKYGRMLEVKNIYNRTINGIPKKEYWVQIQLQLETCKLEYCDFLETRFKEFEDINEFYRDNYEYKGVVLHFVNSGDWKYEYMPIDFDKTVNSVELWKAQKIIDMKSKSYTYIRECYWYLQELSCVEVRRNKHWFKHVYPIIADTWNIIINERETGFEHRAPKQRVYVSNENDSRMLHNMKTEHKLKLVKLI